MLDRTKMQISRSTLYLVCWSALGTLTAAFLPTPSVSLRHRFHLALHSQTSRRHTSITMQQSVRDQATTSSGATTKSKVRPPVGIIDLLTKYHWGMQDPKIPLPIPVVDGQAPEKSDKVTQEHLDSLYRDGAVLVRGVLDEKWINYLREVTEWQIKHPHVWAIPGVVSNLYDYIQRSAWTTNTGFSNFMYYSPVASVLGQMAK
jgi:hypothetical protein